MARRNKLLLVDWNICGQSLRHACRKRTPTHSTAYKMFFGKGFLPARRPEDLEFTFCFSPAKLQHCAADSLFRYGTDRKRQVNLQLRATMP